MREGDRDREKRKPTFESNENGLAGAHTPQSQIEMDFNKTSHCEDFQDD